MLRGISCGHCCCGREIIRSWKTSARRRIQGHSKLVLPNPRLPTSLPRKQGSSPRSNLQKIRCVSQAPQEGGSGGGRGSLLCDHGSDVMARCPRVHQKPSELLSPRRRTVRFVMDARAQNINGEAAYERGRPSPEDFRQSLVHLGAHLGYTSQKQANSYLPSHPPPPR